MNDVIALFSFSPRKGISPDEAARAIASGESNREVPGSRAKKHTSGFGGSIEDLKPSGHMYVASVRFPATLFEPGNLAQYLFIVAGKIFGLPELDAVRLLDVRLPDELVPFHGPKFGISGVRRLTGTIDRPHIGTSIKPAFDLAPRDVAIMAYEAALGGADIVTDDGFLTNKMTCTIHDRVPEVRSGLDEARGETGRKTLYAVNVTALPDVVMERAETAIGLGADMIAVTVSMGGYGLLKILRNEPGLRVPIHVSCSLNPAMTRNPGQGMAILPVARLVRILGGDQVTVGSMGGGGAHEKDDMVQSGDALLSSEFGHRRSFPVVSGRIHPGNVGGEIRDLGRDIVIISGDGVHGHPDGTTAGMKALSQAVEASIAGIPATMYAREHYELERALKFFR